MKAGAVFLVIVQAILGMTFVLSSLSIVAAAAGESYAQVDDYRELDLGLTAGMGNASRTFSSNRRLARAVNPYGCCPVLWIVSAAGLSVGLTIRQSADRLVAELESHPARTAEAIRSAARKRQPAGEEADR